MTANIYPCSEGGRLAKCHCRRLSGIPLRAGRREVASVHFSEVRAPPQRPPYRITKRSQSEQADAITQESSPIRYSAVITLHERFAWS